MTFSVKQESFEGPLDLLLSLIEKRKLFINDISLARVADDYIEYVKRLGTFPIADSAHFILLASTLLLIKSKSLLPTLELSEEETGSIHDLEMRLKMYQQIRRLAPEIRRRFGEEISFLGNPRPRQAIFSPDKSTSIPSLHSSIKEILKNLPKPTTLARAVVEKVISLEKMIENLTDRIKSSLRIGFKEFNRDSKDKVHVIVSFLAMLELVKQGIIQVTQESHAADILMETKTVGTPSYGEKV